MSVFLDGKERGMDKLLKKFLCCSCVSLLCAGVLSAPAYGQNGELFFVEKGVDPAGFGGGPTVIDVTGRLGETIEVDIFVNQIGANALTPVRGIAVNFPCVAQGGILGSVEYVQSSGTTNNFRQDFVFGQGQVTLAVDQNTCPGGNEPAPDGAVRFIVALNAGDLDLTGADPGYVGEFTLAISADACGTFLFPMVEGTGLADEQSRDILTAVNDLIIAAAPLNDACGTAIVANSGDSFAYNTNCAATDGPAGCSADADIWYSITADCGGTLVAVAESGAQVAIYSGSTCVPTDAEEVACAAVSATFAPVAPGEDYLVRLGSVGGGAITGSIQLRCDPFCDTDADCASFTDACNVGVCNIVTGCFASPRADDLPCDDGDRCTVGDACSSGDCVGTDDGLGDCDDALLCTVDSCDAGTQSCVNDNVNGEPCTDDSECGSGTCTADDGAGGFLCEGCVDFICGPGTAAVCPTPSDACLVALCGDIDPGTGIGTCRLTETGGIGAGCDAGPCACGVCDLGACDARAVDALCASADFASDRPALLLVPRNAANLGCPEQLCVDLDGDILVVDVIVGASNAGVSGAQVFLEYDSSSLEFVSMSPGNDGSDPLNPFVFELFQAVDELAGTIAYAVGNNPVGGPPVSTTFRTVVAVITFRVLDPSQCKTDARGLSFDLEHNPGTLLSAPGGTPIIPACHPGKVCQTDNDCDGLTCREFRCDINADDDCDAGVGDLGAITIGTDPPEFLNCELDGLVLDVGASCDSITADLSWDPFVAVSDCSDVVINCTVDGVPVPSDLSGVEVPEGQTRSVRCTAVDDCGNADTCSFDVTSSGRQNVVVDIEVSPTVADNITRCFTFDVSECGELAGEGRDTSVSLSVDLGTDGGNLRGHGTAEFSVEPGNWECISVRDPQHTLASTCQLECVDGVLHAAFKGGPEFNESCHWLINGNLNGDTVIDVLDFVIWTSGADDPVTCDVNPITGDGQNANINGDTIVDVFDFSFILINFFENDKAGCDAACSGGAGATDAPNGRAEISVRELARMGYTAEQIRRADVTRDGMVDMEDMAAYMNGDAPQTRKRATSTRGQIGRR